MTSLIKRYFIEKMREIAILFPFYLSSTCFLKKSTVEASTFLCLAERITTRTFGKFYIVNVSNSFEADVF